MTFPRALQRIARQLFAATGVEQVSSEPCRDTTTDPKTTAGRLWRCAANCSGRASFAYLVFSLHPAKDRQLEVFPEAIDVAEADFAQPVALFLDRLQNVRGTVGTFHERSAN